MKNSMFSTQMWPEIMVSRVLGEVEHQVTLFDKYFTKKSILQVFQSCHSLIFMYFPETSNVCIIYSDVAWKQGFQSLGMIYSSFYCVFTIPVLSVSSLLPACVWSIVDTTDSFCQAYSDVAWDHGVWSPRRNFTLKSSIFEIIQCRFGFYSIFSLCPACVVNTVFIYVESTEKWPENKYPESWDAQMNKEFCPCC